jgi:hypothetical protein
MSALASCGHNRANSFDAPKARRKLVASVALTDTSLALSPGFASGLFYWHTARIEEPWRAGGRGSSTRAQSPPHSVWGDREAAVRSMLSLILWRLSNALVHAKASAAHRCAMGELVMRTDDRPLGACGKSRRVGALTLCLNRAAPCPSNASAKARHGGRARNDRKATRSGKHRGRHRCGARSRCAKAGISRGGGRLELCSQPHESGARWWMCPASSLWHRPAPLLPRRSRERSGYRRGRRTVAAARVAAQPTGFTPNASTNAFSTAALSTVPRCSFMNSRAAAKLPNL